MALDLRADGDGWQGTFGVLVRAALQDILIIDEEPIVGASFWLSNGRQIHDMTVETAGSQCAHGHTATGEPVAVEYFDVERFTLT